jgi:type I restriction enzyme, S subunit
MSVKLSPYPEYKDSGVPRLGEIPAHWHLLPLRAITKPKGERGRPHLPLLSVYREYGVILKTSRDDNHNRDGSDLSMYKVVEPGNLVINKMKTWQGSLGVAQHTGIVSPAYIVCGLSKRVNERFIHHLLRSRPYVDHYNRLSVGVRIGQWDMRYEDLKQISICVPPEDEQTAIATFLEHADHRINRLIRTKRRMIELLNEQKQAIVQQAVTRGLDPNVRLKPSGIDWLGDVPEHWEVAALWMRYSVQLGKMLDTKRITGDHLVPYLRNTDVQWDRINVGDLPVMDIIVEEYPRYTVQRGDLLVCEGGEVGRAAIWNGPVSLCGYQKALHRLRPSRNAADVPRYLFYSLFLAAKRGVFVADGNENTIAHLTAEKLRRHRFAFPPQKEQQAISDNLDATLCYLGRTVDRASREIDLLREYRTRLIADVVTGKLDVRGMELPAVEAEEEPDELDAEEEEEAAEEPDEGQ